MNLTLLQRQPCLFQQKIPINILNIEDIFIVNFVL